MHKRRQVVTGENTPFHGQKKFKTLGPGDPGTLGPDDLREQKILGKWWVIYQTDPLVHDSDILPPYIQKMKGSSGP